MLSYLELENFKSFSHVTLDLRGARGEPKNFVLIYGENGSGKSNLMFAMLFLSQTFSTMENQRNSKKILELENDLSPKIKDKALTQNFLSQLLRAQENTLSDMLGQYKTIGCEAPLTIKIGFRLNGKDGVYQLVFDKNRVVSEELKYNINERLGTVFSISDETVFLSPSIFTDNGYKDEMIENITKFWGKHTFMAILFNECRTKNSKYIEAKINKKLLDVIDWMRSCSVLCKFSQGETARIVIPFDFFNKLESGTIQDKADKELKACENALNTFFTQLYSDIKAAHYVFNASEMGFSYELYFSKLIDNKIVEVPISLESTGTKKLLDIFPLLFSSTFGKSVFIDEIDSGIHDLLIDNVMELLKESLKGQFIATTHNTLLMEGLQPENVYIIQADAQGCKEVTCVSDYKFRTQKNNSIRSKYLHGEYEGIPYIGNLDFGELVEDLFDDMKPFTEAEEKEGEVI